MSNSLVKAFFVSNLHDEQYFRLNDVRNNEQLIINNH